MKLARMFTILAGGLLLSGAPAFADLLGDSVTVNYLYPDINSVYTTLGSGTVTAGGFTVNSFSQHDFTVFGSEIDLSNVNAGDVFFLSSSFNGYQLINNSGGDAITGVSIITNNISGFDASRISFDANDVWVNLHDLTTTSGLDLQLGLNFNSVPEPGTLAALGVGLAAIGVLRRKRLSA
jgi:hypothetical protein